jgi:AcrR family transcriptional regulator
MNSFIPRKKPTQARSRATFEAIIEGGAQVLVEDGFHQMTTNSIAERAGVSIGSLYQYFPNKEAIVASIVERFAERQFELLVHGLQEIANAPLEDVVRHLVNAMFEAKQAEPELNRVLVEQLPPIGQLDVMRDWTEQACQMIEMALQTRRDEVEVEDLEMAAFMMVTACHGIMHSTLLDRPRLLDSEEIREHTARMMLQYLGCRD